MKIKKIQAREILDSRGCPTVEVVLKTSKTIVKASVPSGKSTGIHEAFELRDGGKRYLGKGVLKAVKNINKKIAPRITGKSCKNQKEIDNLMLKLDKTKNKANLGANAILAVSMAVCRAGALSSGIPLYQYIGKLSKNKNLVLPVPFFNVINGGRHADNKLAFQEFMIAPVRARTFSEALRIGSETYHVLKDIIKQKYGNTGIGDEGGFAPDIRRAELALELLEEAIEKAEYKNKIKIAIDAAASEFYKYGFYYIPKQTKRTELINYYLKLIKKYPIVSIEDPFAQDDFGPWTLLTKKTDIRIIGDDLLATNMERIKKAVKLNLCNALLLKINQIGTITEALQAAAVARKNKFSIMVSHRSGETCDSFIADLAVGLGCGQIKSGAPCRGERVAKYNQLLRIEQQLGKKARYAGQ